MDLNLLNAVAQLSSAAGVIATLVYLALTVRQNTRAIRRAAYQELLNYITNVNLMLTSDRELCAISIRVRDGLALLDEADQMRMLVWFGTVFRHYQNAFDLYREGIITTIQWENMSRPLRRHLATQGGRDMWTTIRPSFSQEFRDLVDTQTRETDAARPA